LKTPARNSRTSHRCSIGRAAAPGRTCAGRAASRDDRVRAQSASHPSVPALSIRQASGSAGRRSWSASITGRNEGGCAGGPDVSAGPATGPLCAYRGIRGLLPPRRQRFSRPSPAGGPFARQFCARFASSTHDRPEMWLPADASKAARAKQLPAWLSAKRTAAFGSVPRARARRHSAPVLRGWRGQFQGQLWGQRCSPNSKAVVYLGFSPR
jgi:hypothetical protein